LWTIREGAFFPLSLTGLINDDVVRVVRTRTRSIESRDVLAFWRSAGPDKWFTRDDAFDAAIRKQFLSTYEDAAAGRLTEWEQTAEGAFALIIMLDQFPRNLFRGTPRAFATDGLAREVAGRALAARFDREFPLLERRFFFMPFMHSEVLADQERCVALCRGAGDAEGLKYANIHADIIRRFGRFPHRNQILGRTMTPDEQAFLESGGFFA
jgi:uncharacterized protein (DUF924 family)